MDFWRPTLCEISVQICNLKIGPLSHWNGFHVFHRDNICKAFTCMHNPVFEHSDALLFAVPACIILLINGKQFRCSIFTLFQYNLYGNYWTETTLNDLVNHCILSINWVNSCSFYQQQYSPIEKNQKYAEIPSYYRTTQKKHQVENFVKKYCSFFYPHIEKFKRK